MNLRNVDGKSVLRENNLTIQDFVDKLRKNEYDPQSGDCVSFAVCLHELFDGDGLVSCWIPQNTGAPGTLHTTCAIDGTLYDSHGVRTTKHLVDMGFEELIYYSPPDGPPDLEWVNDASNDEVREHAREHLVREEDVEYVQRNANNYDDSSYETVKRDFKQTLERIR